MGGVKGLKTTDSVKYQSLLVQNPTNSSAAFCKNVLTCKEASGYTWQEISDATGVSESVLKSIAMGNNANYKIDTLVRLARFFNLSTDELCGAGSVPSETIMSLQRLRRLGSAHSENFRALIKWTDEYMSKVHYREKFVPVIAPQCDGGTRNLIYNVRCMREPLDISNLNPSIRDKIVQAVMVPCEHYLPFFFRGDYLLIAKDREPMPDEVCVLILGGNLWFANLLTVRNNGTITKEFHSIVDGHYCCNYDEVDLFIGYVCMVYSLTEIPPRIIM